MQPALMSSRRMDWRTPSAVLDLVRQVGPIALDPCASKDPQFHFAQVNLDGSEGRDAFTCGNEWWSACIHRGLVFVNPPYGRALFLWSRLIAEEAARPGFEGIILVPARTDTRWWGNIVAGADAVCFWRGRMHFDDGKNPAPFPTALVYHGDRAKAFRRAFSGRGWVVRG